MNREEVIERFESMEDYDKIFLWTDYCYSINCEDYSIYGMDDFDEIMENIKPWDISRMVFYGDFNPTHKFFKFNGYGNLESSDYLDDWITVDDDFVDFLLENMEE